ncbi:MAG: GspH/FimT family pseudopilin [Gammaproteobacteria bacterium]
MEKQQTGFTLIELMIVIGVLAVLAAVAMPYMRDTILNQRVRTAVTDAHLSLLLARSEAIKRNSNVNIEKTGSTWDLGWIVCVARAVPDEDECEPAITTLSTRNALEDVTVDCNTDTDTDADTCPDFVAFSRVGRPISLIEYRFYVNGNARVFMRCVRLSVSGVPRVAIDQDGNPLNGCQT